MTTPSRPPPPPGRHLTTAERAGLAALLTDAGPHEVLITVAGWVANNVTDLATGDRLATAIRHAAKDLATLYIAREGEPATELAACNVCHRPIRWVPGVLTPPEGAPQPPRVCRKCQEAVPAPVTPELSTEEIIESINERTPVAPAPPWNGWCICLLTRRQPKEIKPHGVFCERCGRWVQPPTDASHKRAPAPDETFCPTCKGEGVCAWPPDEPAIRCTHCDGSGCVSDPIATELIARAREQAAREGRPVTVRRRGRDMLTAFPDGHTVPALRTP